MLTNQSDETLSIRVLEPGLVRLAGTRPTLDFVHACISQVMLTPNAAVRFPTRPVSPPGPQEGHLELLRIRVDGEPLNAIILGQHLVVTGMSQCLALLANAFQAAALGPVGAMADVRYREGHTRIDRRSVAIQVERVG